ncbi:hypothetical protein QZM81_19510 [Burkholderia cepacia]|uniref:hypothetical protein n=1 Tax=Burkholderia cepacia TaxID=292 RepID=UPI00264C3A4A|nr:hypothetical protein [Burkholderia cepacia]MDN7857995.1 hypothetical protein [Burkholderia cepacia]
MNTIKTLAAAAVSIALSACGGGGGGGSPGNNTGGGTTTTTNNGAALLAAYAVPASIAADVVTNYTGTFNVGNSGMQSNCANAALVSTTVVNAPDVVVFTTTASVKSQEVAADLFEQAVPQIRAALGLPTTGTGFDGTNKIQLCIDPNLGTGDGETGGGTSITGQTAQGPGAVIVQVMSPDSPNFDARYPGATYTGGTVGLRYFDLFRHEGTHAALYSLAEPFGGMEAWFQEGMATTVSQLPMGSKASVLAAVQATDLIPANGAAAGDMGTSYPAYEATIGMLTSSAPGGLGYGLTNIPAFVATYKAKAVALCQQPIPAGLTPNPNSTGAGIPAGQYNVCAPAAPGAVDGRLETAFDQAFNATFKNSNSNGSPLYLHTADDPTGNSLEQTLYARLNAFLN